MENSHFDGLFKKCSTVIHEQFVKYKEISKLLGSSLKRLGYELNTEKENKVYDYFIWDSVDFCKFRIFQFELMKIKMNRDVKQLEELWDNILDYVAVKEDDMRPIPKPVDFGGSPIDPLLTMNERVTLNSSSTYASGLHTICKQGVNILLSTFRIFSQAWDEMVEMSKSQFSSILRFWNRRGSGGSFARDILFNSKAVYGLLKIRRELIDMEMSRASTSLIILALEEIQKFLFCEDGTVSMNIIQGWEIHDNAWRNGQLLFLHRLWFPTMHEKCNEFPIAMANSLGTLVRNNKILLKETTEEKLTPVLAFFLTKVLKQLTEQAYHKAFQEELRIVRIESKSVPKNEKKRTHVSIEDEIEEANELSIDVFCQTSKSVDIDDAAYFRIELEKKKPLSSLLCESDAAKTHSPLVEEDIAEKYGGCIEEV